MAARKDLLAKREPQIDPATGQPIPVPESKPVPPRPLFIVYKTADGVVDGKFNPKSITLVARDAKEALAHFGDDPANLSFFNIMAK